MTRRHEPRDATGRKVEVGTVVRVIGVPDLSGMAAGAIDESRPVFEHLVGKYKVVVGFDDLGCAELFFRIRKGPLRGYHTVWIEPFLLRVKRPRAKG